MTSIITAAKHLYSRAFWLVFPISFISALASALLQLPLSKVLSIQGDTAIITNHIGFGLLAFAILVVYTITDALLLIRLNATREGFYLSLEESFSFALRRLFYLLVATIIFLVVSTLGLWLYIVPGVIIAIFLYLYAPGILFDNHDGVSALAFSAKLVSRRFLYVGMISVMLMFLRLLPSYLASLMSHGAQTDISFGIDNMVAILLTSLILPFSQAIVLLLYYELKTTKPQLK